MSILLYAGNTGVTATIAIIAAIISVASILLLVYENKKWEKKISDSRTEYGLLNKEFESLKTEHEISNDAFESLKTKHEISNTKENILSQIINCANKALEDGGAFQVSMKDLVKTIRITFKSEYCAIGKVINDLVEDYACDYVEHDDSELQSDQKNNLEATRKVNINNTEYIVCEALKDKEQQIRIYNETDIGKKHNNHYIHYKKILKSEKLSNTTVIPLRNNKSENLGYIQFINSETDISIDAIKQFQDGLLQLVQMIIKKEKDKLQLDENRKFIDDSNFIKTIIQQKDDVDKLLDSVLEYLSEKFNAAVISFRIPVLNGKEKEPLFYLRRCYVNPKIQEAEKIKEHYYTNRLIKNKNELGGYDKLKCHNNEIIPVNSIDCDYYSAFDIDLKEQTIIMPVLKDIDKNECMRIEKNPFCKGDENKDCIERFKKLYGLFKLRLFKDSKNQDAEITKQEETYFIEEAKKRLLYLSGQITLIFNSVVDKCENESLKIFRENLKGQQFLKIRDFDKQFVEIIKKSTHAKECSIYRYREDEDYSKKIYLNATTSKRILYKGTERDVDDEIIKQLSYPISDETSMIVRVFKEKKSKYLYNLRNGVTIGDFIELINGANTPIENESFFLIPIIKKNEDATCLGVIVLFGKQKDEHTISTSYWEQDKGLIEFIVEVFTRISEADNERLTFLSQLTHELRSPITEVVQENDFLFNRYAIRKESFDKKEVLGQLKNNVVQENDFLFNEYAIRKGSFDKKEVLGQLKNNKDNCFLFQHIVIDIEHIYSSSIKDIAYKIELQQEPQKILYEVINLFRTTLPINPAISEMPPLYLDKYRIKQVFINILKNAIKYSFEESYRRKPIEIYYKSPKESDSKQHEIRFVNYGIGILEEDRNKIFELYKRGKNASDNGGFVSGSGMGLYIVKEIMKAHNGDCIIRKLGRSDGKEPTEISLVFPIIKNQKQ
ncbi:MAG: HAMP domain-containing histidine kinase [Proteiniphilum sp.]|jgi:signal transduction histidine kinase|nr:HAMP domain-containing histidine kinase [Proteiniphilum sp.]